MMTMPLSSFPRRPALPLIWMYSELLIHLCLSPSHFLNAVKTTVFAGIFKPMANVSVAKSAFTKPSWKRISMISFRIGKSPEWCMAIPLWRRGSIACTAGSCFSESSSCPSALSKILVTISCSSLVLKSICLLAISLAYVSHSRRLKLKTITGYKFLSLTSFTIFTRSSMIPPLLLESLPPLDFFPFSFWFPSSLPGLSRLAVSLAKLLILNCPCSSLTKKSPFPPMGKA
mmetsp:Transcript_2131/g.13957  ORF Transcript_2131/g.13957 Transcript_2131/m.13957 type:complete len:230 (-) Transcript_2131:725-1414(-)